MVRTKGEGVRVIRVMHRVRDRVRGKGQGQVQG
jgi:hypothetical protein